MYCPNCNEITPYLKSEACLKCGAALLLSATDLLGESPKRLVPEIRPPQVDLSKVVEKAFRTGKNAVTEAGTGTGKSLALLIPAILAGRRTVVSTATTLLQHQYMEKDLPFLAGHMAEHGFPFRFAVAKGRSHYLCPAELDAFTQRQQGRKMSERERKELNEELKRIHEWAEETEFGDKLELGNEVPKFWNMISAEDCSGAKHCPRANHCGLMRARVLLRNATVIVANHSMVGFNIRLGRKLLPEHSLYIMDEAHQAAEYFRKAFASTLNEKTIPNMLAYIEKNGALPMTDKYDGLIADLRDKNKRLFKRFGKQTDGSFELLKVESIRKPLEEIAGILDEMAVPLTYAYEKKGRETVNDDETKALCEQAAERAKELQEDNENRPARIRAAGTIVATALRKLQRVTGTVNSILLANDDVVEEEKDATILYLQHPRTTRQSREIVYSPIFVRDTLQQHLFPFVTTAATSATVTIGGSFKHFMEEMGFEEEDTLTYITASPFDYEHRAMLYCSKNVPLHPGRARNIDPSQYETKLDEYYDAMAEEIVILTRASEGHAFALFTSRIEMQEVFHRVAEESKYVVRMQDETTTTGSLEEWFRNTPNPILFGLKSFWEGISIEGDQLRLVMIAKAPFPLQGDPVYQAKKEILLKKNQGNTFKVFNKLDVPAMITDIKQGTGRLIRTQLDYGVVAILDRKVSNNANKPRSYAALLINSLPYTMITANLGDVKAFLRHFRQKD